MYFCWLGFREISSILSMFEKEKILTMTTTNLDPAIQARANVWLRAPYDEATITAVNELFDTKQYTELTDSFYKDLVFGTGGLRGVMGVGTNRMNKYTIGRATQGLSNYLLKT